jgi:hypothetical protein
MQPGVGGRHRGKFGSKASCNDDADRQPPRTVGCFGTASPLVLPNHDHLPVSCNEEKKRKLMSGVVERLVRHMPSRSLICVGMLTCGLV